MRSFAGFEYFDPRPPCDATQIGRFRACLGEAGLKALLSATIHTAVHVGAIHKSGLERVIVDTTVQEKVITHSVNSRLLEIARGMAVAAVKRWHGTEANLCRRGQDFTATGGRLPPSQTVQAPPARGQTPAHHPWHPFSRDPAQDERQHCKRCRLERTEHLAGSKP